MRLSKLERDSLVERATKAVTDYHGKHIMKITGPLHKHCLLWAFFTVVELRKLRIPAQLQAGTAYWPISTPETDDGVSPTQYGYDFDIHRAMPFISDSLLPEMHVWAAVAEKPQEIIDLTAPFFKKRAIEDWGYKYTAPDPPPYLWCSPDNLPTGARYWANRQAIEIANSFLHSIITNTPLVCNFTP